MLIGQKIAKLRIQSNLTQEQLAENYMFQEILFQNGKQVKDVPIIKLF